MHTMYFFTGLCLGSICGSTFGLLLALLLAHSRAQSLAEEMTSLREAAPQKETFAHAETWDRIPPARWRYAHSSTGIGGTVK